MQNWNYCTFWCDEIAEYGYVTRMGDDGPRSEEVRPADREDFLKFKVRVLNTLGGEGWEMVSAVPTPSQAKTLYFKRPAQSAPAAK